jgi:uncharacterized protein
MIPSRKDALELMKHYRMPAHIIRHSMMVMQVSLAIATFLTEAGHTIDRVAVESASLLHDLCKMDSLHTGKDHALMAQEVLCDHGYPFVGEIVGQHVRLKSLHEVNEAMVVNYADKRVMHDRVVSLSKRFADLMNRYGTNDSRRERILKHHQESLLVQDIMGRCCRIDLEELNVLNLVSFDESLYG